jgi:hypothetical protein
VIPLEPVLVTVKLTGTEIGVVPAVIVTEPW